MASGKAKNDGSVKELKAEVARLRTSLTDVAAICDEKFRIIDLRLAEIENGPMIRESAAIVEKELGINGDTD